MRNIPPLSGLLQRFFVEKMVREMEASPHTIACYRDTFRLLLRFAHKTLDKHPSSLDLTDVNKELIDSFLDYLQKERRAGTRTRNLRLSAIKSFFHFAAYEEPAYSEHIKHVLSIPTKRRSKRQVEFLIRPEIDALLAVPDLQKWIGRRDHALLLLSVQTGLRLSEVTSLVRDSVSVGTGAHVRCEGKGRKERCTPLTPTTVKILKAWLKEQESCSTKVLFPTVRGMRMSSDAVQYLLAKYLANARSQCPSLKHKRVSFHTLRHTAAMELLQAGVDSSTISLWLGHESPETTQVYLHAHMALKEAALKMVKPLAAKPGRYQPEDKLLQFLDGL